MVFVQNVTPPRNERFEFTISDFSGGLNNRSNVIEDNQASNLLNMKFMHDDVMEKRNGIKQFDDLVLDGAVSYMNIYRPYTEEDQLIRASSTEVYANQKKIADVQGDIDGVTYQGM